MLNNKERVMTRKEYYILIKNDDFCEGVRDVVEARGDPEPDRTDKRRRTYKHYFSGLPNFFINNDPNPSSTNADNKK